MSKKNNPAVAPRPPRSRIVPPNFYAFPTGNFKIVQNRGTQLYVNRVVREKRDQYIETNHYVTRGNKKITEVALRTVDNQNQILDAVRDLFNKRKGKGGKINIILRFLTLTNSKKSPEVDVDRFADLYENAHSFQKVEDLNDVLAKLQNIEYLTHLIKQNQSDFDVLGIVSCWIKFYPNGYLAGNGVVELPEELENNPHILKWKDIPNNFCFWINLAYICYPSRMHAGNWKKAMQDLIAKASGLYKFFLGESYTEDYEGFDIFELLDIKSKNETIADKKKLLEKQIKQIQKSKKIEQKDKDKIIKKIKKYFCRSYAFNPYSRVDRGI